MHPNNPAFEYSPEVRDVLETDVCELREGLAQASIDSEQYAELIRAVLAGDTAEAKSIAADLVDEAEDAYGLDLDGRIKSGAYREEVAA